VVIADVGQHQMWAAQRYRSSSPRGFITSGGLGAMGFALPAAVGVQLAKPETCVLCVSGDGRVSDEHPGTRYRAPSLPARKNGDCR